MDATIKDVEVLQYATQFRHAIIGDGDSTQMCAAISGPLASAFAIKGIPALVMESDLGICNHVFLRLADGRILDPTADQFNWCSSQSLPGVYLGPETAIHKNAWEHRQAVCWMPLLEEFRRFAPQLSALEVGTMVRQVLMSFPPSFCQLPT